MHSESIFSFKYELNALTQSNRVDCNNVWIGTATVLCIVSNYILHFKNFYIFSTHKILSAALCHDGCEIQRIWSILLLMAVKLACTSSLWHVYAETCRSKVNTLSHVASGFNWHFHENNARRCLQLQLKRVGLLNFKFSFTKFVTFYGLEYFYIQPHVFVSLDQELL